jgi:hypothetical protein
MMLSPMFIQCPLCDGDRDNCLYCDGRGFTPIEDADAAHLVDKITDRLILILRCKSDVVDALADARPRLVDLILYAED